MDGSIGIRHPALGWPGTALALCALRPMVADTFRQVWSRWGVQELAHPVALLASELVTNAVAHAGTTVAAPGAYAATEPVARSSGARSSCQQGETSETMVTGSCRQERRLADRGDEHGSA